MTEYQRWILQRIVRTKVWTRVGICAACSPPPNWVLPCIAYIFYHGHILNLQQRPCYRHTVGSLAFLCVSVHGEQAVDRKKRVFSVVHSCLWTFVISYDTQNHEFAGAEGVPGGRHGCWWPGRGQEMTDQWATWRQVHQVLNRSCRQHTGSSWSSCPSPMVELPSTRTLSRARAETLVALMWGRDIFGTFLGHVWGLLESQRHRLAHCRSARAFSRRCKRIALARRTWHNSWEYTKRR